MRIRRGNTDATILGGNPTFFTLTKGKAVLASVRLASAFFGRAQFTTKQIEKSGNTFTLKQEITWGYFQPLARNEKPNYTIPFDEDRKRRKPSERQRYNAKVTVSEKNGMFELSFEVEGTDNVPLAVELAFRSGGHISGADKLQKSEGVFLLREGTGKYRIDDDEISFGPGGCEHDWTAIRGGLPKPAGDCVYITGFTPFKKKITIG